MEEFQGTGFLIDLQNKRHYMALCGKLMQTQLSQSPIEDQIRSPCVRQDTTMMGHILRMLGLPEPQKLPHSSQPLTAHGVPFRQDWLSAAEVAERQRRLRLQMAEAALGARLVCRRR